MRKVVSNTTPLLSILKIDKLDLLKALYSRILIPEAVFREVEAGRDSSYYTDLSKIDWIEIRKVENPVSLEMELIPSVKALLTELRGKGVWLSTSLIDHVSRLANE